MYAHDLNTRFARSGGITTVEEQCNVISAALVKSSDTIRPILWQIERLCRVSRNPSMVVLLSLFENNSGVLLRLIWPAGRPWRCPQPPIRAVSGSGDHQQQAHGAALWRAARGPEGQGTDRGKLRPAGVLLCPFRSAGRPWQRPLPPTRAVWGNFSRVRGGTRSATPASQTFLGWGGGARNPAPAPAYASAPMPSASYVASRQNSIANFHGFCLAFLPFSAADRQPLRPAVNPLGNPAPARTVCFAGSMIPHGRHAGKANQPLSPGASLKLLSVSSSKEMARFCFKRSLALILRARMERHTRRGKPVFQIAETPKLIKPFLPLQYIGTGRRLYGFIV